LDCFDQDWFLFCVRVLHSPASFITLRQTHAYKTTLKTTYKKVTWKNQPNGDWVQW